MGGGPLGLAVAAVAATSSTAEVRLALCGLDEAAEGAAVERLAEWSRSARVELEAGDRCEGDEGWRAVFQERSGRVVLRLSAPAGREYEREVPWLETTDAPLTRLAAAGLLSHLALLIDGLVAEHFALQGASAVQADLRPERGAPSFGIVAAVRVRTPALTGAEIGATAGWRFLWARASYAAPLSWDLGGRAIRLEGAGLSAGAGVPLSSGARGWTLHAGAGIELEALVIRRTDLPEAASHWVFDVGPCAEITLGWAPGGSVRASLALGGAWHPTSHEVQVPGGPSEVLNRFAGRASLAISYGE